MLVTSFMLNLRRTALGRALVAVREKDYAAAVIGVNSFYFKLVAFATSSFIGGVTGAILIGTFYHAVTPEQFSVDVSIQALAMVIVGGLGSIIGSYFGAAFILLMPGAMNSFISWPPPNSDSRSASRRWRIFRRRFMARSSSDFS